LDFSGETGEVYMELRIRIPSLGLSITMSVAHRLIKKSYTKIDNIKNNNNNNNNNK